MALSWEGVRRILAVRLDNIGDLLMSTPALRALKESLPGCEVVVLASPAGAAVARLVPLIDGVIVYEAPWVRATHPREDGRADREFIEHLRKERFDAAVVFTVATQNPLPAAMLCYLADIPRRLAHCRENPYQLLTDWVGDPDLTGTMRHEVRRQLDLVATVGAHTADERLALAVPEAARADVRQRIASLGCDSASPWVVFHPGASAPSRRYRPDGFAAAARTLAALGLPIVFTGSAEEAALIEGIRLTMGAPSHSLAGRLDLAQLAALIESAPVLVANNTGPVHIAAAVGTPVVDLYALTNPQHTPWAVPHRVLNVEVPCRDCHTWYCPEGHHDCLDRVEPGAIVQAVLELCPQIVCAGSAP